MLGSSNMTSIFMEALIFPLTTWALSSKSYTAISDFILLNLAILSKFKSYTILKPRNDDTEKQ